MNSMVMSVGMPVKSCPFCGGPIPEKKYVSWGGWVVNLEDHEVIIEEVITALVRFEAKVFAALVHARGQGITALQIFDYVYGEFPYCDQPRLNVIYVYLCKLRRMFPGVISYVAHGKYSLKARNL